MIHVFRKNQRILMLIVAILTIIAFAWLYNPNIKSRNAGPNSVAQIYGKSLSQADIDREVKSYSLALNLQQFDLIRSLGGMTENETQALNEFIFNLLVLKHEADELGVVPTDSQIADHIKVLPVFQTGGQFDPRKYAVFVEQQLGPRGFTELQLESIIRDSLRLERIKDIVAAPVAVSSGEIQAAARTLQKIEVQQMNFPLSAAEGQVTVTAEEVQVFYARNKQSLRSPETRVVQFVEFAPSAGQPATEGRAKIEAQQKLADLASAFAETAAASSFEKAAESGGLTVQTSAEFDKTGNTKPDPTGKANALGEDLKALAPSAFLLAAANAVSDVLQVGDRFYVVKLAKVNPQRELTVDEVRPLAEARIKAMKTERIISQNAGVSLAKVRAAMAEGKSFAEAAAAAGLKAESLATIDFAEEKLTPVQQEIARVSLLMEPGQISGLLPGQDGGLAFYLASRAPLDEAAIAREKTEIEPGILENKRQLLFMNWLASARDAAKISIAQRGR
jgi:hypothetical protein